MKAILIAIALAGSTALGAEAQDIAAADVPQAVTDAVTQQYADAKNLDWEMDGTNYEAEFNVNRVDHKVLIDPSGKILKTKRDIAHKDLPQAIRTALDQAYKGMRLDDTELVEMDGTTYYQVELDQKGQEQEVVFSEEGTAQTQITFWD